MLPLKLLRRPGNIHKCSRQKPSLISKSLIFTAKIVTSNIGQSFKTADTMSPSTIPKSDIKVLSQQIDDKEGLYRIRGGQRVYYLTIPTTVYDEDTMCQPHLLIPVLPNIPSGEWTMMNVYRRHDGSLDSSILWDRLVGIRNIWHPRHVDVLSLQQIKYYGPNVREMLYNGRAVIMKFAPFEWNIVQAERETEAYRKINQTPNTGAAASAPAFLAHVTENGRVMGMLLEKVEGDAPCIEDLPACAHAVHQLHCMGLIHGDVNRFNFILDRARKRTVLVDYEHTDDYAEAVAVAELASLSAELTESTGRGRKVPLDWRD